LIPQPLVLSIALFQTLAGPTAVKKTAFSLGFESFLQLV
jgi:hypothetical protein